MKTEQKIKFFPFLIFLCVRKGCAHTSLWFDLGFICGKSRGDLSRMCPVVLLPDLLLMLLNIVVIDLHNHFEPPSQSQLLMLKLMM